MSTASVIVPAYNSEKTLSDCLRAIYSQDFPKDQFEVIVVDDGSTDGTGDVAKSFGAHVFRQRNRGPAAARNAGLRAALGEWVAFTDADCMPTRTWLRLLIKAATDAALNTPAVGAAGKTLGFQSHTPAARFCDIAGSLDAQHYLTHPKFPFAPSLNLMYRRDILEKVGGFDERYVSYEACDLHWRITHVDRGPFVYEPRALVFHRHRENWKAFWRQQYLYGIGYGQFVLSHRDVCGWTIGRELREWSKIGRLGLTAWRPLSNDRSLYERGEFIKKLAQRLGFIKTQCDPRERARW